MIYAPPSRERSKQTVRSPAVDKTNGNSAASKDEYLMGCTVYSGSGAIASGQSQFSINGKRKQLNHVNNPYGVS